MIDLDVAEELARAGALWAIPGVASHWLRVCDGRLVGVLRYTEVRPRLTGAWTVSLPGRRRGLAAVFADALGVPRGALRGGPWARDVAEIGYAWGPVRAALEDAGLDAVRAPEIWP